MGIDKPSTGSDATSDRPRAPEHPVPRRENPAARERPATPRDADAPTTRQGRGSESEERRLARIARRAEVAPPPEAPPKAPPPQARPEAGREPRPGDKGVITHFRGPTVDLYTDGTRWASGDVIRAREAERQRREGRAEVPSMREHGRSVIGDKPDDASDLPPDRKDLMKVNDRDRSVLDKGRRVVEDDEVFGDLTSTASEQTSIWQRNLDYKQPQGHPIQVQRGAPHIGSVQYDHPSAGAIVETGIALAVIIDRGLRGLRNIRTRKKEVD